MHNKSQLIACSPSEAQKQCNFVIFVPAHFPADLVISEQYLRPESKIDGNRLENNRSTFRQVFKGAKRTLIIKQFLYDFTPPAYDYPCLWRNHEMATEAESPAPSGQFVNNNVLWFGMNYRKQEAATIEIERTRVEITFAKGKFSKTEIASLCKTFLPADDAMARQILNTPFSQLSYSHRYIEPAVSVPVGFWEHTRSEELISHALEKQEIPDKVIEKLQSLIIALKAQNYILNSGFGFGKNDNQFEEIELIFEHQNAPGCLIRILCAQTNSPFSILVPPKIGDQECVYKTLCIHKNTFYYATSKNFAFGSHEIVFNKEPFNFMLIIKPAPWTTFEWFMEILANAYSGESENLTKG